MARVDELLDVRRVDAVFLESRVSHAYLSIEWKACSMSMDCEERCETSSLSACILIIRVCR